MPGTLVHDASGPVLQATATKTSTFTGAAVEVDKPGRCRVKLVVPGAVTGTNPTLDVEVQSSNASAFSGTVISHGKFATVTDTTGTAAHYLQVDCQKTYMRIVGTIGGTNSPTFTGLAVTVEEPRYQRTATDTA